jgi:hypothetical protein
MNLGDIFPGLKSGYLKPLSPWGAENSDFSKTIEGACANFAGAEFQGD